MKDCNKTNLVNAIIWDKYFGIDLLIGNAKQNFDLKAIATKEKIVKVMKKEVIKEKKSQQIDLSDIKTLEDLYSAIEKFDGCPNLKTEGNKAVYYDGIKNAKIMLIGEAPGEEESLQGIPFCGQSGQLLDKVLESIKISRKSNLYITNAVFWRPPANRKPTDSEIESCRPFLEKTIDILKPKIIILCGSTACHAILQTKESMANLRQKEIEYTTQNGTKTTCISIYHPAFLLRNPISKKAMWFDMLFIKKFIN